MEKHHDREGAAGEGKPPPPRSPQFLSLRLSCTLAYKFTFMIQEQLPTEGVRQAYIFALFTTSLKATGNTFLKDISYKLLWINVFFVRLFNQLATAFLPEIVGLFTFSPLL